MKALLPWIFIAFVLRLFLIPSYIHPDLKGFNFAGYLISQKGELLTFYDYLSRLPLNHQLVVQYHRDLFIYPPLAYLTPAVFMKVLSPLYPWTHFEQYVFDDQKTAGSPEMTLLAYLLKAPYLLADLFCLWLILKLVDSKHQKMAGLLWLFNPITLYSTYLIGQFDIYLVTLVLLSVYFAKSNQTIFSVLTMGLAAAFKPFPLFLLPFVMTKGSVLKRLVTASIGLSAFLLVILPYLPSEGFRNYALLAPQSDKLQFAKIMVSATQYLPLFFVGLIFLLWKHFQKPQTFPSWGWYAVVFLLFYSLSHFHPQWFLWSTPFLIIWFVDKPQSRLPLTALLLLYLIIVFTFEPSLNTDIFRLEFSLMATLSKFQLGDYFASLIRGAFAATSLYLVHSLSARD